MREVVAMYARTLVILLLAAWAPLGCGPDRNEAGMEIIAVAGSYEVTGTTVEEGGGNERRIAGTIILAEEGSHYTATFNLNTQFPTSDGLVPVDVIGVGEGIIAGNALEGTARTQIVMSSLPGVDTRFAYAPRFVGRRIESESTAQLKEDGSITVEIRNRPSEGEQYTPTRTTLHGVRALTARVGESLQDLAPPRAED